MPKFLFYSGTAFCLFVALSGAAGALQELEGGPLAFVASGGVSGSRAAWAIVVSLVATLAVASIFLRMAVLVAARNLFAAFVALFAVSGSVVALVWLLMLQMRMLRPAVSTSFRDLHLASVLMLAWFVAVSMLALRPYFRIQASRILATLVFLPLPLVLLIVAQELFVARSSGPLPGASPALTAFLSIHAVLFFAIAVHCIRHRYLFLEMTNLRELLDRRVDPAERPTGTGRPIGGVAFDS